jgi:hypothetical protein
MPSTLLRPPADPAERRAQLQSHWRGAWQAVLQCTDLARLAGVHSEEAQASPQGGPAHVPLLRLMRRLPLPHSLLRCCGAAAAGHWRTCHHRPPTQQAHTLPWTAQGSASGEQYEDALRGSAIYQAVAECACRHGFGAAGR